MTDADLGEATIVYDTPDGDTDEMTVDNEHIAYFQDHWLLRTDEDEEGQDTVRRIPATRVYYVERDVDEFEEEVQTLRNQVQSLANDLGGEVRTLRNRIESVAAGLQERRTGAAGDEDADEPAQAQPIEIEVGEGAGSTPTEEAEESTTESGSDTEDDADIDRSL